MTQQKKWIQSKNLHQQLNTDNNSAQLNNNRTTKYPEQTYNTVNSWTTEYSQQLYTTGRLNTVITTTWARVTQCDLRPHNWLLQTDIHSFHGIQPIKVQLSFSCECLHQKCAPITLLLLFHKMAPVLFHNKIADLEEAIKIGSIQIWFMGF